jgi:hypothetical protein
MEGPRNKMPLRIHSSELLLSSRPHLLKFPEPLKLEPHADISHFNKSNQQQLANEIVSSSIYNNIKHT